MSKLFAYGSFQLDGKRIVGLVSRCGTETLRLVQPVEVNPGEDWVGKVEDAERRTLMEMTTAALAARQTMDRHTWLESYPT